eukprot:286872-Pleurochrysis_carterae.AAC.2
MQGSPSRYSPHRRGRCQALPSLQLSILEHTETRLPYLHSACGLAKRTSECSPVLTSPRANKATGCPTYDMSGASKSFSDECISADPGVEHYYLQGRGSAKLIARQKSTALLTDTVTSRLCARNSKCYARQKRSKASLQGRSGTWRRWSAPRRRAAAPVPVLPSFDIKSLVNA